MKSSKELSVKLFQATLAPDLDTFDDLLFSAFRAMVAIFNGKSDKGLMPADFKNFLDQLPAGQRKEMSGNVHSVADALIARLAL